MVSMVKSASVGFGDFDFREISKHWYFGDSLPVAPSMDRATVEKYEREYDKAVAEFKSALISGTVEDEYLTKIPLSYRKKHNLLKPSELKKKTRNTGKTKLDPREKNTKPQSDLGDYPDQEPVDFSNISEDISPKWTQNLSSWLKAKLRKDSDGSGDNGEGAEAIDPISLTGKLPKELKEKDTEREVKKQSPLDKFKQSFFKGVLDILKQIDKNTKPKKDGSSKPKSPKGAEFDFGQTGTKRKGGKFVDPFDVAFGASTSGKIFNATMRNVSPGLAFAMQLTKHQLIERKKKQFILRYKKKKEEADARSNQPVEEPVQSAKFNIFNEGESKPEPQQDAPNKPNDTNPNSPKGFSFFDLLSRKPNFTVPQKPLGSGGKLGGVKNFATGALRLLGGGSIATGAGVLAAGAVAADSLTDAYKSATTGESNKYSDVANSAARKLFGWDEGETIGSKLFDTFNKSDIQDTKKMNSDNLDKVQAKTKADVLAKQEDKATKKSKEQNMVNTSVNSPSSTTNVMTPNTQQSGGKGIGTRNVDSSFKRYLDSRANFA